MSAWKVKFFEWVRDGMSPDIAARRLTGMSLSEVEMMLKDDEQFGWLWSTMFKGDVSDKRTISRDALEKLLWSQATDEEAAGYFGMDLDDFLHQVKSDDDLLLVYETARAGGRAQLRRKQFEAAIDGHVAAQSWLGKQYLGQSDKIDKNLTLNDERAIDDQELARRLAFLLTYNKLPVIDVLPEPQDATPALITQGSDHADGT